MTGDGMEFWVVYHYKMTAADDEIDELTRQITTGD